ncbi:MAG: glycosyltransferase [Trueperaceae bacterium]
MSHVPEAASDRVLARSMETCAHPEDLRIAYVRPGPEPRAAEYILDQLRRTFPEHAIDVIEVKDMIRSQRAVFAINALATMARYGPQIVRRERSARDSFFRTPYIFRAIRDMVRRQIDPGKYLFSIQIQSLFDASVPGVPHFVYTDHTNRANLFYGDHGGRGLYPPVWQALEQQIYLHAERVLVRSRHVARSLEEHYAVESARIRCVYAGSNVPMLRPYSERTPAVSKDILFVGMDWERKGGPDLLAAFRRVRDRHPDATLTLVGEAPEMSEPGVRVLGRLGSERLDRLYAEAAVFALPTLREPFGIVFVEAMERGLPIVATTVGALPDMVEDGVNGYLVEPGDVDALADRLNRLLDDPEARIRQGAAGRRIVEDRYNWDAVGTAIADEVRSALARV